MEHQMTLANEDVCSSGLAVSPGSVRALSLWRPWADWVMLGWKTIETRTHQRFRCLGVAPTALAIHAAVKWDATAIEAARRWLTDEQIKFTETVIRGRPVSGIIGTVEVMAFGLLDAGDEAGALIECSTTRFGLWLTNPRPLVPPIPAIGRQGLFWVTLPSQNAQHEPRRAE